MTAVIRRRFKASLKRNQGPAVLVDHCLRGAQSPGQGEVYVQPWRRMGNHCGSWSQVWLCQAHWAQCSPLTWTRCCSSRAWLGPSMDRFAGVQPAQRQVRCMGTCLLWKSGFAVLRLAAFVITDLASFSSLSWYRSAWRCSCERKFLLVFAIFLIKISWLPFPQSVFSCLHKESA